VRRSNPVPLSLLLVVCATACGGRSLPTYSIQSTSGSGTANIDGTISPGEWAGATTLNIVINFAGGGILGKLLVMNDATDLYLAFTFDGSAPRNSLSFEFDVDGDDRVSAGDDGIAFNPENGFLDFVRVSGPPCNTPGLCGLADSDVGGTNEGAGAFRTDGTTTVYELRHPLKSGDRHDVSLSRGSTIGLQMSIRLISQSGATDDTTFPGPEDFLGLTIR
jgi:hypothetical protein